MVMLTSLMGIAEHAPALCVPSILKTAKLYLSFLLINLAGTYSLSLAHEKGANACALFFQSIWCYLKYMVFFSDLFSYVMYNGCQGRELYQYMPV